MRMPQSGERDATFAHPAYAEALHRFQCWRDDPIAALAPLLEGDDPGAVDARLLRDWVQVLGTEAAACAEVAARLERGESVPLSGRQRQHLQALGEFVQGEWSNASRLLEDLSLRHPRDALALQAGHLLDYYLGDARMLRERCLRALPHWSSEDAGYHALLGMAAFGANEGGDALEAERLGRLALDLEPLDAWAHHAVAHSYETRGESRAGAAWMAEREAAWAAPSYLSIHNAWHWALFLIDQGRLDDAMALYDQRVRGAGSAQIVDLIDASALLLRLRLAGSDAAGRWQPLLQDWSTVLRPAEVLFNDLHAAWAALGAGRVDVLEGLLEAHRLQGDAGAGERCQQSRQLGVPLMRALLELARGHAGRAVAELRALRPGLHRLGGSRAQRDLIELVLIDAALKAGQADYARGLIQARSLLRARRPERRQSEPRRHPAAATC